MTVDEVRIVVEGETFTISRRTAAILALNLTETASEPGRQGSEGAAACALAIDDALAGNTPTALLEDDVTVDALFYALNMPTIGDSPELAPLYTAARTVHERLLDAH